MNSEKLSQGSFGAGTGGSRSGELNNEFRQIRAKNSLTGKSDSWSNVPQSIQNNQSVLTQNSNNYQNETN